ncbi:MAG: hypothetical protein U0835_17370 [Isosphaeraceae bacterium]
MEFERVRPRWTTSQLMAVVAGVSLGLTVGLWRLETKRRAAERYSTAYRHAAAAGLTGGFRETDLRQTPLRDYHRKMMEKWIEASRHPWSHVEPDTPAPKEPIGPRSRP